MRESDHAEPLSVLHHGPSQDRST